MSKKTFSRRLSWKIISITSAIFIVSLASIAIRGSKMTVRSSVEYVTAITNKAAADLEAFLDICENTCTTMGQTIEEFQNNNVRLDTASYFQLLEKTLHINEHVLGIGVYYEPGKYIRKNTHAGIYVSCDHETGEMNHEWQDDRKTKEDGWVYFTADWYSKAKKDGKCLWLKPFIDHLETGEDVYMTTFSYPMKDKDGKVFGVCSLDISLDWMYDKLIALKPYENSNVVVYDNDYDIICNPIAVNPYEGSLYNTPFIKGSESITFSSDNGSENWKWEGFKDVLTIDIKEGNHWSFCISKTMSNGWGIIISNMYNEAFADMFRIWVILSFIAVAGLLILYFLSRKIVSLESKPLVKFANAASKITGGKFDIPIPEVNTEDEIEDLGHALTYMQAEVSAYIEKLETTTSEKERLAGELDVAKKIQMEMLCKQFPDQDNASIFADSIPAKEVGGDLYDFHIDGKYVNFIIGDVSGKGVPAALLMAISIAAFRATIYTNHSMTEIVSLINDTFCKSNEDMMFVTLIAGRIDTETNEMELCNAGHNPMVVISPAGKAKFIDLKNNLVCGVMPGFNYEKDTVQLEKGSRLILYTDGITEAETASKSQYGEGRLLQWAEKYGQNAVSSDEAVVRSLIDNVHSFTDGAEQNDDMTIMSITLHDRTV